MRRAFVLGALLLVYVAAPAAGQADSSLTSARAAYDSLDYAGAIQLARRALAQPLGPDDLISAYELLGYSYGALDSTRQAVDAFRRLIFLAPDREPDVERVSPRITSLYASALGQVLVVRRLRIDSASFVAGAGSVPIRFELSRTAVARTRVVGPGTDLVIDSQTVAGAVEVAWTARDAGGRPLRAGEYDLVVTAREGEREEYSTRPVRVRVDHGTVDTLPLLNSLPGYFCSDRRGAASRLASDGAHRGHHRPGLRRVLRPGQQDPRERAPHRDDLGGRRVAGHRSRAQPAEARAQAIADQRALQ